MTSLAIRLDDDLSRIGRLFGELHSSPIAILKNQLRVLASVDGQLVPIPINLDTIERLYGLKLTPEDMEKFLAARAEPVAAAAKS